MSDIEFDTALVTAAFRLAGDSGWHAVSAAAAARAAGLPLDRARSRFPSRASILIRFGDLADQEALRDAPADGPVRDRLFDLLMRRFDTLQANRAGVQALLRTLPMNPVLALKLALATQRSMRWMLQGAGIEATGPRGELQIRGLLAVWLWAVRAWEKDESEDLSGTMAAVDSALQRAEQAASWVGMGPAPDPAVSDDPMPGRDDDQDEPGLPEPSPPPASGQIVPDPSI